MPFKSKAQQGYLEAKKPAVAKRFETATPRAAYAKLPEHVRAKKGEHHARIRRGG